MLREDFADVVFGDALHVEGARFAIPLHERPVPTDEEVEAVVAQRTTALLEARLRDRDKLQTERSRRFVTLARSLAESEEELALIAMLLDDYYQQAQHAPLPSGDGAPPPQVTGPTKAERTSRERSDRERDSGGSDRPRRRGPRR